MLQYPRKQEDWILWVFLFGIPLLVFCGAIMRIMIEWKLTLGEIITLAITLPSVIFALVIYFRSLHQKKHYFDIVVSFDPVRYGEEENRQRNISKTLKLKTNTTRDAILVITSKQPYSTQTLHLYFNAKKESKGHTPKSTIELLEAKDEGRETWGHPYLEYKSICDGTGAINVVYKDPRERAKEDKLYLTVKIKTSRAWQGYLVFYCTRNDGNRGYGYLPVKVG